MRFTSDNAAGAAPEILAAVARAAEGSAASYGADPISARLEVRIGEMFERDCRVFLTTTGTAANALAIASFCPPWGVVFCHRAAHIEEDECGAPEFYAGGAKLTLIDGAHGRIASDALADALRGVGARGVHQAQPAVLSLTQASEAGAVYSAAQVAALAEMARDAGCAVHMDGTRFANAVARLGATPADLSWRAGVEVMCFGATKNGALGAEAVVFFDPADPRIAEFEFRRKRGGHLLSKMRFVAAQMEAYLTDGLWLRLAGRANALADRLAAGLAAIPSVVVLHPVEANIVFAEFPRPAHDALRRAGALYYLEPAWQDENPGEDAGETRVSARFACSYATEEAEVDALLEVMKTAV